MRSFDIEARERAGTARYVETLDTAIAEDMLVGSSVSSTRQARRRRTHHPHAFARYPLKNRRHRCRLRSSPVNVVPNTADHIGAHRIIVGADGYVSSTLGNEISTRGNEGSSRGNDAYPAGNVVGERANEVCVEGSVNGVRRLLSETNNKHEADTRFATARGSRTPRPPPLHITGVSLVVMQHEASDPLTYASSVRML